MLATLAPLTGAALAILCSMAVGTLLLRRLGFSTSGTLTQTEYRLFAFLTGAAGLSLLVLALAALQLVYSGVFCVVAALLFGCAWLRGRETHFAKLPAAKQTWARFALVAAAPFFAMYFFTAWAPEFSPDGSSYHLGNVLQFVRHHGLMPIRDLYGAFPEGLEMLFLFAFPIGRHSAAALVHFSFLVALPLLMYSYAHRFGFPRAGAVAALMVFASPVFGIDGVSAYNDVALAATIFGVVYLLELWLVGIGDDSLLIPAGILAGFAFSIKDTGVVVVIYALVILAVRLWSDRRLRPILLFAACSFLLAAPWLVKNAVYLHNPVAPFLNRVFPNPWISPRFEADYTSSLANAADTKDPLKLIAAYLVKGDRLVGGVLGPLFLLTPLGLISLRRRQGRRLILAAILFALPVLANQGTRFLMPAAPPAALALAMAVVETSYAAPVMIALAAFSGWPAVTSAYADMYAWRLRTSLPVAAAWHRGRMDDYLHQRMGNGYDMAKIINAKTPPGSRIFCFSCPPQAYMNRESLVWYESTLGNALAGMLYLPNQPDNQPVKLITLTFAPTRVSKLRVSAPHLRANRANELWLVNELRVFDGGAEVPRSPRWRIDARPDPWEARFAFDNNPGSHWSTEERGAADAFLEIDFDQPVRIDSVQIRCGREQTEQLSVLAADGSGAFTPLNASATATRVSPPPDLRRDAVSALKSYGFQYLVINKDDYYSGDYNLRPYAWGIQPVARAGDITLFRLE